MRNVVWQGYSNVEECSTSVDSTAGVDGERRLSVTAWTCVGEDFEESQEQEGVQCDGEAARDCGGGEDWWGHLLLPLWTHF